MAACARKVGAPNAWTTPRRKTGYRFLCLWSRLKTEELGPREWPVFRDLADARHSVATYFDYYNHERRHSALAYQTPQAFYLQQLKNTTLNSLA